MKVAVLLSTFNGENYLNEQLDSIIAQKGDFDLTIVVRDDGSSDNTINILNHYKVINNLIWYKGNNLRSAKSFIDLLYYSDNYDYYAFSDQDDFWKPDKLICGISMLKDFETPAVYYSNAELVDKGLKSLGRNVYRQKQNTDIFTVMCSANILGCSMIFNKELVDIIKSRNIPEIITMHDSFVSRVCLAVGGVLLYDHETHLLYRQHENNVIGIKSGYWEKIYNRLHAIFIREVVTLDCQSKEILDLYGDLLSPINKKWLEQISNYRKSIFLRISLAFSRRPKYVSKNMEIIMRLSILLGNH